MSKLRLLLALFTASLCSVLTLSAQIAPTLPTAQQLITGNTYYLYNVGSGRFLTNPSNSNVTATTNQGTIVKVTSVNGNQYSIQFVSSGLYLYSLSDNGLSAKGSGYANTENCHYTIKPTEGGYTIQRVYNAVDTLFVGVNSATDRNPNYVFTDKNNNGNVVWQLFQADEYTLNFMARHGLYLALEAAEGYEVSKFETIYNDETSSNSALLDATTLLNKDLKISIAAASPEWSEYKVLLETDNNNYWGSNNNISCDHIYNGETRELNAYCNVNDDATLSFYYRYSKREMWGPGSCELQVYLDGVLQYPIQGYEGINIYMGEYNKTERFFLEMPEGKHTITWKALTFDNTSNYTIIDFSGIGIQNTPTISVSLKEAGSLGTEVLYHTDNIANVRKLSVRGSMNTDDWARIKMMNNLYSLDLTEATSEEIPKNLSNGGKTFPFLHRLHLPSSLKKIGYAAFADTPLDEVTFQEGLTSIGGYAFYGTRIKEAMLPASFTTFSNDYGSANYVFANNQSLEKVSFPSGVSVIPEKCFQGCYSLQPFEIPKGVETIKEYAFRDCYYFDSSIPSTLKTIEQSAFENSGITNATINENCFVGMRAFKDCRNLTTVILPSTFVEEQSEKIFEGCGKLTDITFKSSTMVTSRYKNMLINDAMASINLHVPSYLVNTYKQDSYWYNCNVVGFNTSDIKDWTVNRSLALGENDRIEGSPNITVNNDAILTIKGETAMPIDTLTMNMAWNYIDDSPYYCCVPTYTQLLINGNNISVEGNMNYRIKTWAKTWHFLSLPFDFKVGDLTNDAGASYAIRYYDGATRAANGASGNWKNYSADDVVKAGTGFIYQTSKTTTTTFTSLDSESKQYAVSNKVFTKALEANPSDNSADKGWNLVGNPWICYYNIHKMNFVAPITVWDMKSKNYSAYSVIDDDYAIRPNEAFFVQCPDEISSISFPVDGRQLDTNIESQNGAKPFNVSANSRKLIDLQIMDADSITDKTRIVVNSKAKTGYETSCDASKFFSFDNSVPQLYTIGDDGTQYAINERPEGDGNVSLGMKIQKAGTYTIKATRNGLGDIFLTDLEQGVQVNLANESYTFSAEEGTLDNRFVLSLNAGGVTSVNAIDAANEGITVGDGSISVNGKATIYSIDGSKVAEIADGSVSVASGVYVVKTAKGNVKVNVK